MSDDSRLNINAVISNCQYVLSGWCLAFGVALPFFGHWAGGFVMLALFGLNVWLASR